ncbi:heparan-alpha-glucosaminide N-acetyltransferase-like, partial [Tropilaelaps mercedesae]
MFNDTSTNYLITNGPTFQILWKIVTRSVKLFVIGLILNSSGGNNNIASLRIPGVLQRFAISYFIVATVHTLRVIPTEVTEGWRGASSKLRDVIFYWPEWLLMSFLVAIHLLVIIALPVPGCPTGYLGPGGLHMGGAYFNCTGGAAGYVDRLILGTTHIYQRSSAKKVYHGNLPHDPEGLLGCLTSIFLTFLGLQAGKILLTYPNHFHRISRWISWAIICGLLAGILCGFSKENGAIPVNKNLWSLSFVLCNASSAFVLLTLMYIAIDVLNLWAGGPFIYPGMNSIIVYVGHMLVTGMLPWFW